MMSGQRLLGSLVVVLLAIGLLAADSMEVKPDSGVSPEPIGGRKFFFCALGQTVKYIGVFTGNVGLAVAGALGGGIACGMGW